MDEDNTIVAAIDLGTDKIAGGIVSKKKGSKAIVLSLQSEKCKPGTIIKGNAVNSDNTEFHLNSILTKLSNASKIEVDKCIIGFAGQPLFEKRPELATTINDSVRYLRQRKYRTCTIADKSLLEINAEKSLTEAEKNNGCLFIDLGCGTTSFAVYEGGTKLTSTVWPAGTSNIVNDLQTYIAEEIGLVNYQRANIEKLYLAFGTATIDDPTMVPKKIRLSKAEDNGHDYLITYGTLNDVLHARLESNLGFVKKLKEVGWFNRPNRSIVISGGGSRLKNLSQFLQNSTGVEVRFANLSAYFEQNEFSDLIANPVYFGLESLLLYGDFDCRKTEEPAEKKKPQSKPKRGISKFLNSLFDENNEKI